MTDKMYEAQKALAGVWGKLDTRKSPPALDKSETYEMEFSQDTSWGCMRRNAEGPRRFKLTYDRETNLLWWGGSYFLDPGELVTGKAKWYRANDKAKKKAAFAWAKVREGPAPPPPKPKAKSKAADAKPKTGADVSARASVARPKPAVAAQRGYPSADAPGARYGGAPVALREKSHPEVILDLEQVLVIYKPPYWKCELPEKGTKMSLEEDPTLLPNWLYTRSFGIDKALFEEEFNPALSGTGFGPLAHRIDAETSGPMLVAKSAVAQRHLKSQFHKTAVSKRYMCLVHGLVAQDAGTIDAPIRTLRTGSTTRSEVSSSGEWAKTRFEVVARYQASHLTDSNGYSLVACDITSGRTHQIRVHMLNHGHPLVADDKYLPKEDILSADRKWCARLFLHAYRLQFKDMNEKDVLVVCPLPEDLKRALRSLGLANAGSLDSVFGETSLQREVLRPSLLQWQPGTQALRIVAQLLSNSAEPISLKRLNEDYPELRAAMDNEGVACIGKAWLAKHWTVFELAPETDWDDELCVRLRSAHIVGENSAETDLEKQIDVIQTELEDLQRQKQRAVAQEDYTKAAEIKRRSEVVQSELASLVALCDDDVAASGLGRLQRPLARKKEEFTQNVHDEELFPSLPMSAAPPRARSVPRAMTGGHASAASSAGTGQLQGKAASDTRSASVDPRQSSGTQPDTQATGTGAANRAQSEPPAETAVDLKEALIKFLEDRKGPQGCLAHINQINNDFGMKKIMAAQRPRVSAITKAWIQQHTDVFALGRSDDGSMYVILERTIVKKSAKQTSAAKDAARAAAAEKEHQAPKTPAYYQVVQKTCEDAPPLVYKYSAAERASPAETPLQPTAATAEQAPGQGSGSLNSWQEKFLAAIRREPSKSCSTDALLAAVPSFAVMLGAKKPHECRELLLMFLQSCPEVFRVDKKTAGAKREYFVSAK
eukprot:TRINITY_DN74161_c0_g1_i1.p1 TRINITY_DN74161_c0_g1~~TRINITY_DN74161_c0_g1_i1.p1  ORF type:complete len:942 (-),score=206.20 TRINITY_DN74161_c0_g1_i1:251-3076(-)